MRRSDPGYRKAYYAKNRDKMCAARRAYYYAHRSEILVANKTDEAHERERLRSQKPHWRVKMLLNSARQRAKERGIECTLQESDIVIPESCPIFGTPFIRGGKVVGSPSIDRIDNKRGYTSDNIHVISKRANALKGDADPREIKRLAEYLCSMNRPAPSMELEGLWL